MSTIIYSLAQPALKYQNITNTYSAKVHSEEIRNKKANFCFLYSRDNKWCWDWELMIKKCGIMQGKEWEELINEWSGC